MKLSIGSGIRAGRRTGAPLHVTINIVASLSQTQTTPNPTQAQVAIWMARQQRRSELPKDLGGGFSGAPELRTWIH